MTLAMPRLTIVADDLTGAADSAARAVRAGLRAAVFMDAGYGPAELDTPLDVAAITTDSRHLTPENAGLRVAAAIAAAGPSASWYKKIDSTLRGNVGAELVAMLSAISDAELAAVVCPAFPAQGRGLADGFLVHGGAATRPPHVPRLLEAQASLAVAAVGLATVRGGPGTLAAALHRARRGGARLLVVDALSDEDLAVVVAAGQQAGMLLCGSAGMVGPLAERLQRGQAGPAPEPVSLPSGPILMVVGSGSAMAHQQIRHMQGVDGVGLRRFDGSWIGVDLIGAAARPAGDWLIHLAPPGPDTPLEGPVARANAANLADLAHGVTQRLQPAALIVVGGDTAHFVLRGLGIRRLDMVEELLPGIPLALAVDREGARRAVVLKPGSFGDENTLETLLRQLRQRLPVASVTGDEVA